MESESEAVAKLIVDLRLAASSLAATAPQDLAPRIGLPLHLATTTGVLLLAVGLGEVAASGEHLHGLILWITCGGLALHALASGLAGLIGGTGRFWLLTCALPALAWRVASVRTTGDAV